MSVGTELARLAALGLPGGRVGPTHNQRGRERVGAGDSWASWLAVV